jgi:hypothetical protein
MRPVEARVVAVRRWWGWPPVGLFVGTRIATAFVAWLAYLSSGSSSYVNMLTAWDAFWYHRIASQGYGELPVGGAVLHPLQSYAFFPVVPIAARGVHLLTGLSVATSGVVVSMAGGLAGTVALWKLVQRRLGDRVASDSVLLLLVAPFAFVFSLFYTEGPALLAVALCFLALDRKRWFWAGVAAAAAGLIRPNGFLLVVPCALAALLAVRHDRDWKSLVAPALAPVGFLVWIGVVAQRTGELTGYFTLQRQGLGATVDFGAESARGIVELLTFQWGPAGRVLNSAALLVGALGLTIGIRRRLDPTWLAYAAAVLVVTALNQNQASGGRYLLLAFPLFVAFALAIPKRAYPLVVAMSAVVMGGVFYTVLNLQLTP